MNNVWGVQKAVLRGSFIALGNFANNAKNLILAPESVGALL